MKEPLLAQLRVPGLPEALGGGPNPVKDFGLISAGKMISAIASLFLVIATIGTLLYFALGGLQWVTAGGDKTQLENARNKITNAIIGLIIVAAAWAVWVLTGNFLGINVEQLPFPTVIG